MSTSAKQNYPAADLYFTKTQLHRTLDTTGSTPTTIATITPAQDAATIIRVTFIAREIGTNQTTAFIGTKEWHLSRGTGNPVLLSAAAGDGFENENFGGTPTLEASVSGSDILITATGINVTNINWQASFLVLANTNNG